MSTEPTIAELFERNNAAIAVLGDELAAARAEAERPAWIAEARDKSRAAWERRAEAAEGAIKEASGELARIVHGMWVAPSSVESMFYWVRRIREGLDAALAAAPDGEA